MNAIGLPLIEHEIRPPLRRMLAVCRRWGCYWWFDLHLSHRAVVYVLANQVMGLVLLPALYQLSGQQLNTLCWCRC